MKGQLKYLMTLLKLLGWSRGYSFSWERGKHNVTPRDHSSEQGGNSYATCCDLSSLRRRIGIVALSSAATVIAFLCSLRLGLAGANSPL